MQKIISVLLTIAITCSFAAAQTNKETGKWIDFSSEKGEFSVSLPAEPAFEQSIGELNPISVDSGKPIDQKIRYTMNVYTLSQENFYLFGWVDYQAGFDFNATAELNANVANFVKSYQATLTSEKPFKFGDYLAKEFTAERDQKTFLKGRVIIIGKRPYLLVSMTRDKNNTADADKFLNSFTLKKK